MREVKTASLRVSADRIRAMGPHPLREARLAIGGMLDDAADRIDFLEGLVTQAPHEEWCAALDPDGDEDPMLVCGCWKARLL